MKHDLGFAEQHKFLIEPGLVAAAKRGDRKAWEEICSRSYKPILLYLRYLSQSEETPKDLAQDVFEKAEKSLGGLRDDRCFCAWLYTIARNKFINHRRTNHSRLSLDEGDREPGQIDFVLQIENRQLILQVLCELSEHDRDILVLCSRGYTYKEIAHLLQISLASISQHIHRAKEQFRRKYRQLANEERNNGAK